MRVQFKVTGDCSDWNNEVFAWEREKSQKQDTPKQRSILDRCNALSS